MTFPVTPTHNRLFVKPVKEADPVLDPVPTIITATNGSVPGKSPLITLSKTHLRGEVVACGRGSLNFDGSVIAMECKVGDIVLYHPQAFEVIRLEDVEYHYLPETNLIGIEK